MIVQKRCPHCKNITYMRDDMKEAYCIVCGRSITSKNAKPVEIVEDKEETFTVTFHYQRSILSEFDRGCRIVIDNTCEGVASDNSEMDFKLSPGTHHISVSAHVNAGVNSTDVLTSAKIEVDSDQSYAIIPSGTFRRKIAIVRME